MLNKNKYIFALLLLSSITIAQQSFNFYSDYGIFKNDDNRIIIELYYGFDETGLKFIKSDNGYEAAGQLIIDITNTATGEQVANKNFRVPVVMTDTSNNNKAGRLIGQLNILLDSGTYKLKLTAKDFNNPQDSVNEEQTFSLGRFIDDKISSSSIQLSTEIKKSSDVNNPFYKNTLEVEPNPVRIFGNNIPQVFYYIEFYNLYETDTGKEYNIVWEIRDTTGATLKSSVKKYSLKANSKVDVGSFNVRSLPMGNYKIYVRLESIAGTKLIELEKPFFVYNINNNYTGTGDGADYLASEYIKYTQKEVDKEFEYSRYIMKENIINNYEKLKDLDSKKRFMYSFWKALDPSPSTPVNEAKKDYMDRIAYANKNYKSELSEGWRTDRGRIIALYGKPDDIERHPYESETRAYEIWSYNALEGGVIFVFVDLRSDNGDYTLVHSTKRNELRNDDWQNKIKIR